MNTLVPLVAENPLGDHSGTKRFSDDALYRVCCYVLFSLYGPYGWRSYSEANSTGIAV